MESSEVNRRGWNFWNSLIMPRLLYGNPVHTTWLTPRKQGSHLLRRYKLVHGATMAMRSPPRCNTVYKLGGELSMPEKWSTKPDHAIENDGRTKANMLSPDKASDWRLHR